MRDPKFPLEIRRPDLDTVKHFKCYLVAFILPIAIIAVTHFLGR